MTTPPDLSRLTEAEKDALILALWARVAELDAPPRRTRPDRPDGHELRPLPEGSRADAGRPRADGGLPVRQHRAAGGRGRGAVPLVRGNRAGRSAREVTSRPPTPEAPRCGQGPTSSSGCCRGLGRPSGSRLSSMLEHHDDRTTLANHLPG